MEDRTTAPYICGWRSRIDTGNQSMAQGPPHSRMIQGYCDGIHSGEEVVDVLTGRLFDDLSRGSPANISTPTSIEGLKPPTFIPAWFRFRMQTGTGLGRSGGILSAVTGETDLLPQEHGISALMTLSRSFIAGEVQHMIRLVVQAEGGIQLTRSATHVVIGGDKVQTQNVVLDPGVHGRRAGRRT